ncbi:MAG TPA: ABC transporter substrate-binding protein [Planctomycetota bacterium]|nr:ABC transporter substrate-binding protein [Planctomycetota bacterium]
MNRSVGLLVFLGILLLAFLVLGLSGGRRAGGGDDRQTLRIAVPKDPKTLDPIEIDETLPEGVARRIFNCLVRYNPDLSLAPDLAESWTVSADGLVYTFTMQSAVRFQNGREMTAADAAWSLSRLADPKVSRRFDLLRDMESCSARDRRTLVVKLKRAQPLLLNILAMIPCAIAPREEVERLGRDFARRPVGTGPFRLVEWADGQRLRLARFADHFAGEPELAAVEYLIRTEPTVRFQAYVRGDVDICDVPLGRLREVRAWADHRSWPELDTFYLGISFTREPGRSNVHLRRALNFAVDRERLCRVILEGRAEPARGVLPPAVPGHDPALAGYRFDPAAAARELELAGFPGGKGLPPVDLYYAAGDGDAQMTAMELQQQFRRAGIPVELSACDKGKLRDMTQTDPPPLFPRSWVADYADPENFLWSCFHSSLAGQSNRVHYRDPEADRLLEAAAELPPGAERLAAWARAERRIVDQAPWVFLYHRSAHLLVKPSVRGLTFTPLDTGPELPWADFVRVRKQG